MQRFVPALGALSALMGAGGVALAGRHAYRRRPTRPNRRHFSHPARGGAARTDRLRPRIRRRRFRSRFASRRRRPWIGDDHFQRRSLREGFCRRAPVSNGGADRRFADDPWMARSRSGFHLWRGDPASPSGALQPNCLSPLVGLGLGSRRLIRIEVRPPLSARAAPPLPSPTRSRLYSRLCVAKTLIAKGGIGSTLSSRGRPKRSVGAAS